MLKKLTLPFLICISITACVNNHDLHSDGFHALTQEELELHIMALASDEFQGRKPFTEGETKTIQYLENYFKKIGLKPGNGDQYLQQVPMVEITPTADSVMVIEGKNRNFTLRGYHDYTLTTERTENVKWDKEELVFAGFGIVAPEYNWNDYEGLDVKGKIVLVLVNDPGFGGTDTTLFKGNTMTYYGRWTYKFEEAARQGAKGCLVIHNTVPAGYPFGVLQNGWNNAHLYLDQRNKSVTFCEAVGWITKAATEKLFAEAGHDFNATQTKARQPGFKALSLGLKASTSMNVTFRYNTSHNVVAMLPGTTHPDEFIVVTSHWDHLGIGKKDAEGDSIYNGAYDNASGTAGLLLLAKAFTSMKNRPKRSIVFLAVTAEEQGLWGSAYYARNPIFPLAKTVANINMDGINPFGKMKDVMVVGKGQSQLEDILLAEAKTLNREVKPDSEPEKGSYFRSDHFNFAKVGVPALYLKPGNNFIGKGENVAQELKNNYVKEYYHQPSDEFNKDVMNMEGGIDDLKLLFNVTKQIAFSNDWPAWKEGSEFRNIRK